MISEIRSKATAQSPAGHPAQRTLDSQKWLLRDVCGGSGLWMIVSSSSLTLQRTVVEHPQVFPKPGSLLQAGLVLLGTAR